MKIAELRNYKKILLLGYGIEGRATHRFLKHVHPEAKIGIADQKNDRNYLKQQYQYDLVIKSPGIPKRLVHVLSTTATNIFFANTKGAIIGITGSKGKSTTSMLVYTMLKKAGKRVKLIGNIGRPMLPALRAETKQKILYVCELSSYQLEDIAYSPHIAVILNLFPEHMDYHGSVRRYYAAKRNIVKYSTARDFFVYNPKIKTLRALTHKTQAQSIPFASTIPVSENDIPLLGEHNRDNIRAAITVARILHIPKRAIIQGIRSMRPLPHRLQNIGAFRGITFYDDAIATTPEATIAAIHSLPNIGCLMLGGLDRGYRFEKLAKVIKQHDIPAIILFPDSGRRILGALQQISFTPKHLLKTTSMQQAVKFSYRHTPKSTICLLSTASPSYSLWKNFEEKGNEFQHWVKK